MFLIFAALFLAALIGSCNKHSEYSVWMYKWDLNSDISCDDIYYDYDSYDSCHDFQEGRAGGYR